MRDTAGPMPMPAPAAAAAGLPVGRAVRGGRCALALLAGAGMAVRLGVCAALLLSAAASVFAADGSPIWCYPRAPATDPPCPQPDQCCAVWVSMQGAGAWQERRMPTQVMGLMLLMRPIPTTHTHMRPGAASRRACAAPARTTARRATAQEAPASEPQSRPLRPAPTPLLRSLPRRVSAHAPGGWLLPHG